MNRRAGVLYCAVQALLWSVYAALFCFANRYLLGKGMSSFQAGAALGAATGVSFLLQPMLTALADRVSFFSCRRILLLNAGVMCLCGALMPCSSSLPVIVGLYVLACVCLQVLPAFANALGATAMSSGARLNFGLARGMGSACFGIVSQALIPLIGRFGLQTIPLAAVLLGALFAVAVFLFPELRPKEQAPAEQATPALTFLRKNGAFVLLLGGTVLLFIGHNMLSNCMYQIAQFKGDGNAQGTALMIAAVLEVPAMFLFKGMLKYAKSGFWMCLSGVFFVLRLVLVLLLPGAAGLYIAQIPQAMGFALFTVSSVYYVGEIVAPRDAVKGQTYVVLAHTLGGLIAQFLGGALIDGVGVGMALSVCIALSIVGAGILAVSVRQTARKAARA